jgi:hypothetical protein
MEPYFVILSPLLTNVITYTADISYKYLDCNGKESIKQIDLYKLPENQAWSW